MQVDTLVMKHFLSGFSDADAEIILKHCREVLSPEGKILLLQVRAPLAFVTPSDRVQHRCAASC